MNSLEPGKNSGGNYNYMIAAAMLMIAAPFIILNFYNHPADEEFYWAVQARKYGIYKTFKTLRKYVGGRYLTYALVSINPLVFGSVGLNRLCTLALMIIFFGMIFYFAWCLLGNSAGNLKLLIPSSILFLYLYSMASVMEGFYWIIGAFHYHLSVSLMMLFTIFCYKLSKDEGRGRFFYLSASCVLAFLIPGTNELAMTVFALMLFVLLFRDLIVLKKINKHLILFTILMCAGIYYAISAPGNFVRLSWSEESRNIFYLTGTTLGFLGGEFLKWKLGTPLLVITLLLIPPVFSMIKSSGFDRKLFSVNPVYSILIWLGILFVLCFEVIFSQGGIPYDRTLNFIYFIFLIGWFYNLITACVYINRKFSIPSFKFPKYVNLAGIALILLYLIRTNNITNAYEDLISGNAQRYDRELNARYETITSSKSDSIEVESVKNIPKSFHSLELVDDTSDWFEQAFAEYYNKKVIFVKKTGVQEK